MCDPRAYVRVVVACGGGEEAKAIEAQKQRQEAKVTIGAVVVLVNHRRASCHPYAPPDFLDLFRIFAHSFVLSRSLAFSRSNMGSLVSRITAVFKQNLTPEALAWSLAFGVTGGVFPIPGTTTFVCLAFIWLFSLNLAATQLANLLCTPLELVLVMPFVRAGEWLFGSRPIAATELLDGLQRDFFGSLSAFGGSLLRAIVAWALFTAVASPLLYVLLRVLINTVLPASMRAGRPGRLSAEHDA